MVPQQSQDGNTTISQLDIEPKKKSDLIAVGDLGGITTVFGSQQVKETSNTPYTDATQVSNFPFSSHIIVKLHKKS